MDNAPETIPVTKIEMRAGLMLACAHSITLFLNVDPKNGDEKYHSILIEKQVEKIIEMMWNKRRD